MYTRVYGIGFPSHFDGNFIPVLCITWTLYGHHTYRTCTSRYRLLYYVGLSHLSFPVWPLGGAKGFLSTLNISAVFDFFAYFFTPSCRTHRALQIPPYLSHLSLPVWGSAPDNENSYLANGTRKFLQFQHLIFAIFGTDVQKEVL